MTEARSAPALDRQRCAVSAGDRGAPRQRCPPLAPPAADGAARSAFEADLHPDSAEHRQSELMTASSRLADGNAKLYLDRRGRKKKR